MRQSTRTRGTRRSARHVSASRLALVAIRRRLGPWAGPVLFAVIGLAGLTAVAVAAPHLTPASTGHAQAAMTAPAQGSGPPPTVQAGVFSLAGQPLPIPANVLRPTNMARAQDGSVVTAVYAGSLTRQPQMGALFVLRDDFATGQQTRHLYTTPRPVGALTILAVNGSVLTLTFPGGGGTFDLRTGVFQL